MASMKKQGFFAAMMGMAMSGPNILGMDMPTSMFGDAPRRRKKGPAPRKSCNRNKWWKDLPRTTVRTPVITARRKANKVAGKSRQQNRK